LESNIVMFSGGKDSTAMLFLMIEKNIRIDKIYFCDTGVEFPEMYAHIKKVEDKINIPITTLKSKHTFEYYLSEYKVKKRDGTIQIGKGWSDFKTRWCTGYLKLDLIKSELKKIKNPIQYIGITTDEIKRCASNIKKRYPLIEHGFSGKDSLHYCYKLGFDWNGLYNKFNRVSCFLCPLQRISELEVLYREYPSLWKYMKKLDKKSFRKFRSDYSLKELEIKFNKKPNMANHKTLF